MKELSKDERIQAEIKSMQEPFADLDDKKRAIAYKICEEAAWIKVSLEDCQKDIDENGVSMLFQQSEKVPPYERERPVVKIRAAYDSSFKRYMKQLSDLIPPEEKPKSEPESDGFEDFMRERDD